MMDKRLYDVLNGSESNYLFPFYWQHGDHTELIPEQIRRIYDSGCCAFCVEARPHPDFVGDVWWIDIFPAACAVRTSRRNLHKKIIY
jgi:hypothetical protein